MRFILIISFLLPYLLSAVNINGIASEHVGAKVRLLRYEDYITKSTIVIAQTQVKADSTFQLNFKTDDIFEGILEVGNTYSYIFIQEGASYNIGVPLLKSQGQRVTHNYVQLAFTSLPPEDDINYLILDFDYRLDQFFGKNVDIMGGEDWDVYLDSFKRHLTRTYKNNRNSYFLNYMSFSTANIELIGNPKMDVGIKSELVYDYYIAKAPVFYQHPAYMRLINNCYTKIFEDVSAIHERNLMKAVVMEDRDSIIRVLRNYKRYQNLQVAEMIMIKGFGEAYMNNTLPRTNILNMLQDMTRTAHYTEHKVIAKNMIKKLTKLKKGYPAQNFALLSDEGDTVTLSSFKGRYVYITFFQPWSVQSISDFKIMKKLQERYGKHVDMISICTGPDENSMTNFLKEHKDFDWTFLNAYNNESLIGYYDINSFPQYYLVDPQGNLMQAPALSPSPKGNYDSIDRTMYNISKSLSRKDDSRPPGAMGRPPVKQN